MRAGHAARAGGRVRRVAEAFAVARAHEHLKVVVGPGVAKARILAVVRRRVPCSKSAGRSRRFGPCAEVQRPRSELRGRDAAHHQEAAFNQLLSVSEAGLMRDSSPFSCRQRPGPALHHPAGSAGAVVSLLMFPQFLCPGLFRAIWWRSSLTSLTRREIARMGLTAGLDRDR